MYNMSVSRKVTHHRWRPHCATVLACKWNISNVECNLMSVLLLVKFVQSFQWCFIQVIVTRRRMINFYYQWDVPRKKDSFYAFWGDSLFFLKNSWFWNGTAFTSLHCDISKLSPVHKFCSISASQSRTNDVSGSSPRASSIQCCRGSVFCK